MTVKQKQRHLAFLGYYPGSIDGIWGRLSAEGTRAFQTDFGLTVDGIFGAQTMAKTMEVITAVQKAVTDGKIAIDGLAGEETRAAMAAWQTSHGLTGTGTADSEARSLLLADDSNNADNSDWWNDIQYFTPAEFRCKCGGRYCVGWPADVSQTLLENADSIREHFGSPAIVTSGLRCTQHNRNVGGVSGSRHLTGKAMDFRIEGTGAASVLRYAKTLPGLRYCYAIDSSHVHIDVV